MSEPALEVPGEPVDGRPDRARSPAHWILVALAPACGLVLVVLGLFISPSPSGHGTHTQLGLPACLSMEWLGVPCPGCGVTTSVALAAHGRVADAFLNQPLGLILAVLLALYPVWALWQVARGRDLYAQLSRLGGPLWLVGAGVTILAAWIYKLATG